MQRYGLFLNLQKIRRIFFKKTVFSPLGLAIIVYKVELLLNKSVVEHVPTDGNTDAG